MSSSKLNAVECVEIDPSGRFKYILVKITHDSHHKYIVRGHRRAAYHADIYDEILPGINNLGLKAECLGGGRIEHNKDEQSILVYGYSLGFGRADHSITTDILKTFYPTYSKITFSNEGY